MFKKNVFALVAVLVTVPSALADKFRYDAQSIKASAAMGWLNGESKEFAYDARDGYKISELNWTLKNTAIFKGDIAWDATEFLTLNLRGWTTLASSGSKMDDYDWLDRGQSHWTDRSTHPNSRLNHANEFDVNVKGWLLNAPEYRLGTVFGYQQTRFSWTAFGGSFNYKNGTDNGEYAPGARAIGYRQKYFMPYLGVAGMYRYQNVEFNTLLKFSPWVKARDNDEHYMRDITFRHQGKGSRYYSATVDAGYYVTPNTKIYAELSLNKYEENKGSHTKTCNHCGNKDYFGGNSSGMSNTYYTASAGVQYLF
ncbi:omptin family outer membrane protease [Sodalis sp. dw_96]|uniref:omptin family outer membrane protease n=1 Tax=Sodalis sp. dw_96 TaxID=2719794 RepID=UPI001BD3CD58|nr:omptin family outer membrane protease [Sodalis sp. dw_96]